MRKAKEKISSPCSLMKCYKNPSQPAITPTTMETIIEIRGLLL
jgi:hypothetical protein